MKYILTERQLKILEQDPPRGKCALTKQADGPSSKEQRAQDKMDRENIATYNRGIKQADAERQKEFSQLANPKYDSYLNPVSKKDPTFGNEYQKFLNSNTEISNMEDDFSPEQRFAILNKLASRDRKNPTSSWYINTGLKKKFNHPMDKALSETDILDYIKKMGGFNSFRDWVLAGTPVK